MNEIEAHIAELVAAAPELTKKQIERLAYLLRSDAVQ